MKGFYNKFFSSFFKFNNSYFKSLNFNSLIDGNEITTPNIKINFETKFFFHPNSFSLDVDDENINDSFFIHVLKLLSLFNIFNNSHNCFKNISFSKLKKSSFRFRKRKNIYFNLSFNSKPQNIFQFFQLLPLFISFFISLSKRIYYVHSLDTILFKINYKNDILSLFFLNPNHFDSYHNNKEIKNSDFISKLSISISQKNKSFVYSLFRNIYPNKF